MHLIEHAFGHIYDLQRRLEIAGGETAFRFRNDARDAAGNDTASIFPGPRSQVDDPVHLCDGAHVMFDDYDGMRHRFEGGRWHQLLSRIARPFPQIKRGVDAA